MRDLEALLEREHSHLIELGGSDFMRRLPRYVAALGDERAVVDVIEEMRVEAEQAQQAYVDEENRLIEETATVRKRFVELAVEADDSDTAAPEDWGWHAYSNYMFTLAYFDELFEKDVAIRYPKLPSEKPSEGPVPDMVSILRGKLHSLQYGEGPHLTEERENQRPDLDDLVVSLSNIMERHGHAARAFDNASKIRLGLGRRVGRFDEGLHALLLLRPLEGLDEYRCHVSKRPPKCSRGPAARGVSGGAPPS